MYDLILSSVEYFVRGQWAVGVFTETNMGVTARARVSRQCG